MSDPLGREPASLEAALREPRFIFALAGVTESYAPATRL